MEGPEIKAPDSGKKGGGKLTPNVSNIVENAFDSVGNTLNNGVSSAGNFLKENTKLGNLEEENQNEDENYVDSTQNQVMDAGAAIGRTAVSEGSKAAKNIGKAAKDAPKKIKKMADAFKKFVEIAAKVGKVVIEFLVEYWYVALILLAILLILIICIILYYKIKDAFVDDTSNIVTQTSFVAKTSRYADDNTIENNTIDNEVATVGNVRELVSIDNENRRLDLNTVDFLEKIDEWFRTNKRDPVDIGVKKDYSDLVKFLEAEIVTFYPDLRTKDKIGTEVPEGELQGCIQFNRSSSDGSTLEPMEFLPYDDYIIKLQELGKDIDNNTIGEQTLSRAEVDQKYGYLRDKFTLDQDRNLIIVSMQYSETIVTYDGTVVTFESGKSAERPWAEEEDYKYKDGTEYSYSYTVTVKKVPYQNYVAKYSMPFELQTILLMATENSGFCEALADLAKGSKIIINVQDNNTINVETTKFSYESDYQKKIIVYYYTYSSSDSSSSDSEAKTGNPNAFKPKTKSYGQAEGGPENEKVIVTDYETIETTNVYSTTELQWELIDTWIAHVDFQYQFAPTVQTVDSETTQDDDEGYKVVKNYHNLSYPDVDLPSGAHVTSEDTTIKEKRTNKVAKTTLVTTTNKYDKISEEVKETPEKFLSLLKVDPNTNPKVFDLDNPKNNTEIIKYRRADKLFESPISNLYNDRDFIYRKLASNNKTKDLEETVRYLIKLLKGQTTLDESRFSIYAPDEFRTISNYYYGGNTREKLWWAIKDKLAEMGIENDVAVAAAVGNTMHESGCNSNNLEDAANGRSGYSDSQFTEMVDNGTISKEDFISNYDWSPYGYEKGGIYGYGLAQWTSKGRKTNLWTYTKDNGKSIADVDAQISYLLYELPIMWNATGSFSSWIAIKDDGNNDDVNEKIRLSTKYYASHFEVGAWNDKRYTFAVDAYNEFHDAERPSMVPDGPIIPYSPENPIDKNTPLSARMQALVQEAIDIANNDKWQYLMEAGYNRGPLSGNGPTNTFDCSGLVSYLYQHNFNYAVDRCGACRGIWRHGTPYCMGKIPLSEMRPGDVVLFFMSKYREPRYEPDFYPNNSPGHAVLYIGPYNGKAHCAVAAHDHYPSNPAKDITVYEFNPPSQYLVYRYFE